MATSERRTTPIVAQYMHPVVDGDSNDSDAWKRNYYAPPPMNKLVPRSYPLVDIRPILSDTERGSPTQLLKSHGFGVVKHNSELVSQLCSDAELSSDAITEQYKPEMQELVKKTVGAKTVLVHGCVVRRGKSAPEPYKLPTGLKFATANGSESQPPSKEEKKEPKDGKTPKSNPATVATPAAVETKPSADQGKDHKLASQSNVAMAAPVRVPHMDHTPLGARQTIRHQQQDMYDAAMASGVIETEDALCKPHSVDATTAAADAIIAEQYNGSGGDGELGPRYAAYSIWRPLRKIERDPLTLAPMKIGSVIDQVPGEKTCWRYKNRMPGAKEFGGDFLKEFAMLGVKAGAEDGELTANTHDHVGKSNGTADPDLKWYYVSSQQPDEVLFIKLFDSAALGANATHAGAPWHASPEIGDAQGTMPRESIELRVMAFW